MASHDYMLNLIVDPINILIIAEGQKQHLRRAFYRVSILKGKRKTDIFIICISGVNVLF